MGTIDSLWEANMDLLDPNVPFDLWDNSWKIYSRSRNVPPQYVSKNADVENSMVSEGCTIEGNVDFSVIFQDVKIEKGATVRDSIIMPGTVIEKDATVQYSIVGENCIVGRGAYIGQRPELMDNIDSWGVTVLGNNATVLKNQTIKAKSMIYGGDKNDRNV